MAYPKHFLLAFGGKLGEEEQWSCSLRMTSASTVILGDNLADTFAASAVEQVASKVQDFIIAAGGFWLKPAHLGYVKFNAIGPDGRYIGSETHQKLWNPEWQRSDTNTTGPFQISTAISLQTDNRRGLAAHGRFFVPTAVPVIDQEGYTNAQFQTSWINASVSFINSLNNWEGPDPDGAPDVCLVSRGKALAGGQYGEGKWARVTGVAVGNVLDTQRRRRKSLREVYLGGSIG